MWIALLATLRMNRSQGTQGGPGKVVCIRGWKVLKIRLHPPPPPLLTSLVPKTPLKKFLTSQDLQEVLGPRRGEQSACKEIFTLGSAQQLTSVSPQMVCLHDKSFSFPKTSVMRPNGDWEAMSHWWTQQILAYTGGNTRVTAVTMHGRYSCLVAAVFANSKRENLRKQKQNLALVSAWSQILHFNCAALLWCQI